MFEARLMESILNAGLIQFGDFVHADGTHSTWQLRFDMLPSYPDVLRLAAGTVAAFIEPTQVSRLVCTPEAVALATLVGQVLGIPLVIHTGVIGRPSHHLVGAYDIGHPAVLISLTTHFPAGYVARLHADAASVGLQIIDWVVVLEIAANKDLRHSAALTLHDVAENLMDRGEITPGMALQIVQPPG